MSDKGLKSGGPGTGVVKKELGPALSSLGANMVLMDGAAARTGGYYNAGETFKTLVQKYNLETNPEGKETAAVKVAVFKDSISKIDVPEEDKRAAVEYFAASMAIKSDGVATSKAIKDMLNAGIPLDDPKVQGMFEAAAKRRIQSMERVTKSEE